MRKNPSPKFQTIQEFIREIIPHLQNKALVREIRSGPVLYVGDIHGFYQNLLIAFKLAEQKQVHAIIFLGDYADRGPDQLKSLLKVMDAFARSEGYSKHGVLADYIHEQKYPFKVIALRGNHEDTDINIWYGFKDVIVDKHEFPAFPDKILDDLYSNLPIIATTMWKTLGVHGGIPKPREGEEVSKVLRYLITKKTPLEIDMDDRLSRDLMIEIYQMLWNDPFFGDDKSGSNFRRSYRGPNIFEFNQAALKDFLKVNGYKRLVRAHETADNGYEIHWNSRLVHIFSASPYFGRVKTAGYFLEFEDGTGEIVDGSGKCLQKVDLPT